MKAVIDTNVLVSGLIKQGTPPAEVVADVLAGLLVPLYDRRTLEEYREVLARPKLRIPADKAEALLDFIAVDGIEVVDAAFSGQLPDPDDQAFADVAFTGGADVLITGNTKDFPVRAIRVVTPREWLEIKKNMAVLRRVGEDGLAAPEPNEPFTVAMACKRCGKIRFHTTLGLTPLGQPQREAFTCIEPAPGQPNDRCGGEIWTYDDNDLGRRGAAALGIPTR